MKDFAGQCFLPLLPELESNVRGCQFDGNERRTLGKAKADRHPSPSEIPRETNIREKNVGWH